MKNSSVTCQCVAASKGLFVAALATFSVMVLAAPAQVPLFLGGGQPLVMLTMSRDHKLYYEAYNDASDINGDGVLDVGYKPANINYFGYFDSFKCYTYDAANNRFNVTATTADKKCTGQWSGDFLNYVTMTRMDAIRKVLYGGFRSTDSATETVLERAFIPQDAHSWGKEYESVARDGYDISQYTPLALPTAGTRHLLANTTLLGTTVPLMRVLQNTSYRVWEWVSIERPVAGTKCLHGGSGPNCGTITDYAVRVEVCKAGFLESDCRGYPRGSATPTIHRPTGLLHEFGEDHSMAFGLLTGSYRRNLQGGVLRKNIANFADEIDASTGQFLAATNGIVKTIDSLRVTGFAGNYEYSCGWITTRPINDGECRMWGNPLGEMMYEALRYLAGETAATAAYTYSQNDDDGLTLPKPAWQNPYRSTSGGYGWCSKPFQMVISDINPSFDSALPGSSFGDSAGALSGTNLYSASSASLDVSAIGDLIWNNETESTNVFIGHSKAGGVDTYDGAPTAKTVSSFATLRGLAPEEPTKQGTYYSASVAYFGNTNRITNPQNLPASGRRQNVQTFSVALASPLPKIEIPIAALNRKITIVPFAKSVGGSSINAAQGQFQPTNQIVDFYIDTIRNVPGFPTDSLVNSGRPFYKFRINFEDVEQGADHDMDAIAEYTITLQADNSLQVNVNSTYAAGGIAQHMGYVISGTTADGTYLVVRDCDTANAGGVAPCTGNNPGTDPDYFLDTPNTAGVALPLTSTRTFNAGTASAQFLKNDPLWYAAKWGGFTDLPSSQDGKPLLASEWDRKRSDGTVGADGVPDNYYLVTNAGELKTQLRSAFSEISARTTSASAIAQNSTRLDTDTMIYQARFNTQDWTGQLRAFKLGLDGTVDTVEAWEASSLMPAHTARNIVTWDDVARAGNLFKITNASGELTAGQRTALGFSASTPLSAQIAIVDYLRGDRSNEQQSGGSFRNRSSILGDIVNSDPVYVYAENFGYEALPEAAPNPLIPGDPNKYVVFRDEVKPLRRKMIYVSSNDGMVHGFDASSDVSNGGVEQFAFVPRAALSTIMTSLTQPNYNHQYLVDGPLFAGDAYFGGAWKTVLLGTTGAGNAGKAVFALDVTDPDQFDASKVLWEISSSDIVMSAVSQLGYPMGQPIIGRMPNGRWAAIFGNGWESAESKARLIIAYLNPDLANGWTLGTDYCVLTTNSESNNGLGTPALLDVNRDGIIDYVYAGDLQGNLWRFKFADPGNHPNQNCPTTTPNPKWEMDRKVFETDTVPCRVKAANGVVSACSPASNQRQPITGPIEIGPPPTGQTSGYMLLFGTGQYYQQSDVSNMTEQAFYAVWDELGNQTSAVPLADLVEQTITNEGQITVTNANPPPTDLIYDYRITSNVAVTYPAKKGWFMKLLKPPVASPTYQGERVVSAPLLRAGRVVFTTLIPSNDPCSFGGDSWIMEVDLYSGGRTSSPSFDLNNDRSFTAADMVSNVVVSGIRSREGIVKTPAVISAGGVEYKYASGTSGNIEKIVEKGTAAVKRTSWRQIQ